MVPVSAVSSLVCDTSTEAQTRLHITIASGSHAHSSTRVIQAIKQLSSLDRLSVKSTRKG